MAERRAPIIKSSDMSEDMQNDANEITLFAIGKYETESEVSGHISSHFNRKYHPNWHCIVGRKFSAEITHETRNYTYFSIGQFTVLLWKV